MSSHATALTTALTPRSEFITQIAATKNRLMESKYPSLDGLRGVSILMVLFAHCVGTAGFPLASAHFIGDLGSLGVRVFFVISGFLITSLLLGELRANGRVDLLRFYARRSVRIFPAAYLFILVVWILDVVGLISLRPNDLLFSLTYTMNHHRDHAWQVGHLWSLAVEEQFYVLWPWVIAKAGARRGLIVAALTILLAPMIRVFMIQGLGIYEGVGKLFPTVADGLATGCLLAGVRSRLEREPRYLALFRSRLFYFLPLAALGLNAALFGRPTLIAAVGATSLNVLIAVSLHRWVLYPGDGFGRVLNTPAMAWIGVLSYSLYLWQQLFLNRSSYAQPNTFPLNLLLTFAAAWASYRLVEKPLMGLRKRLQARKVPEFTRGSVHVLPAHPS